MLDGTTHCLVHLGYRGLQLFMALKKGQSKLIVFRFLTSHYTIPSNR